MSIADRVTQVGAHFFNTLTDTDDGPFPIAQVKRTGAYWMLNRLVGAAVPFAMRNGFRVEALEKGYVRASIPLKGNRNHLGTLYAGAMFVLAEIPGGVMTLFDLGSDYIPILKELTMRYEKLAKTDLSVEFRLSPEERERIISTVNSDGKADFSLEGELKDQKGEVVARSTAHYQVRRREG